MNLDRIEEFLEDIKPEEQYNNFLKDKRVAIVGPSKHMLLSQDGKNIDSYDVVVRLKWLPLKNHNPFLKYIGSKTDVMYSSVLNDQSDFKILSECGVRHSRHPVGKIGIKPSLDKFKDVLIGVYSSEEYAFLLKEYSMENGYVADKIANINSKSPYAIWPQLGFNAIMEAIASDASEVYITGCTMYHGGGHMLQKNKPVSHNKTIVEKHNGVLETLILIDAITQIETNNKRIVLDPVLTKILNAYRHLDLGNTSPTGRKETFTSTMTKLSDEVNNLIKDLK